MHYQAASGNSKRRRQLQQSVKQPLLSHNPTQPTTPYPIRNPKPCGPMSMMFRFTCSQVMPFRVILRIRKYIMHIFQPMGE
jgi:hypothetical protein